jgi:hypothetical protein
VWALPHGVSAAAPRAGAAPRGGCDDTPAAMTSLPTWLAATRVLLQVLLLLAVAAARGRRCITPTRGTGPHQLPPLLLHKAQLVVLLPTTHRASLPPQSQYVSEAVVALADAWRAQPPPPPPLPQRRRRLVIVVFDAGSAHTPPLHHPSLAQLRARVTAKMLEFELWPVSIHFLEAGSILCTDHDIVDTASQRSGQSNWEANRVYGAAPCSGVGGGRSKAAAMVMSRPRKPTRRSSQRILLHRQAADYALLLLATASALGAPPLLRTGPSLLLWEDDNIPCAGMFAWLRTAAARVRHMQGGSFGFIKVGMGGSGFLFDGQQNGALTLRELAKFVLDSGMPVDVAIHEFFRQQAGLGRYGGLLMRRARCLPATAPQ